MATACSKILLVKLVAAPRLAELQSRFRRCLLRHPLSPQFISSVYLPAIQVDVGLSTFASSRHPNTSHTPPVANYWPSQHPRLPVGQCRYLIPDSVDLGAEFDILTT